MSRKEKILRSAQEVFGRYGYAGTTMKMIAERADVAFGLVAHYYGNKDKLFVSAGLDMLDAIVEAGKREIVLAANGLDAVKRLAQAYLDFTLESGPRLLILLRCSPFNNDTAAAQRECIVDKFRELIGEIRLCLERGVRDGSVRDIPPEPTAFLIYSLLAGAVRTMSLSPYSVPGFYDETLDFITRSIEQSISFGVL